MLNDLGQTIVRISLPPPEQKPLETRDQLLVFSAWFCEKLVDRAPDRGRQGPRIPIPVGSHSHAVWLYHRFSLSFRDIEDLLAERGINVTYETIRQWCLMFGLEYARRRRRGCQGDTWYLDELFVRIQGRTQYLWWAVDEDGGSLAKLQELFLNDNQLTGAIPVELSELTRLTSLNLAGNQLSGCIPDGLGKVAINDLEKLNLPDCAQAETQKRSDFNDDGKIDFDDFFLFADAFNSSDARFDLDFDDTVDFDAGSAGVYFHRARAKMEILN